MVADFAVVQIETQPDVGGSRSTLTPHPNLGKSDFTRTVRQGDFISKFANVKTGQTRKVKRFVGNRALAECLLYL